MISRTGSQEKQSCLYLDSECPILKVGENECVMLSHSHCGLTWHLQEIIMRYLTNFSYVYNPHADQVIPPCAAESETKSFFKYYTFLRRHDVIIHLNGILPIHVVFVPAAGHSLRSHYFQPFSPPHVLLGTKSALVSILYYNETLEAS